MAARKFFLTGVFLDPLERVLTHCLSRPQNGHRPAFREACSLPLCWKASRRAPRRVTAARRWPAATSPLCMSQQPLDVGAHTGHLQVGKLRMKEAAGLAQGHMNPDDLTPEPLPRTSALGLYLQAGPGAGSGALSEPTLYPPRRITSTFSSVWPLWPSTGMTSLSSSWPPTRCFCTLETWPCT